MSVPPLYAVKRRMNLRLDYSNKLEVIPAFRYRYNYVLIFQVHKYIAAFRKSYSCQSVLLSLTEDWRKALDHGNVVGTVLMDLSKAFDSMPHSLLICKIHAYGMSQNSLQLLTSESKESNLEIQLVTG